MRAIVTVVGKDRVGIIAQVCTLLSQQDVNVLDISQTVLQGYFTMIMLVDASASQTPFAQLVKLLEEKGREEGLVIHAQQSAKGVKTRSENPDGAAPWPRRDVCRGGAYTPLCHQAAAERERLEETLRAAYMPSLPCRKGGLMWWPPSSA